MLSLPLFSFILTVWDGTFQPLLFGAGEQNSIKQKQISYVFCARGWRTLLDKVGSVGISICLDMCLLCSVCCWTLLLCVQLCCVSWTYKPSKRTVTRGVLAEKPSQGMASRAQYAAATTLSCLVTAHLEPSVPAPKPSVYTACLDPSCLGRLVATFLRLLSPCCIPHLYMLRGVKSRDSTSLLVCFLRIRGVISLSRLTGTCKHLQNALSFYSHQCPLLSS